MKPPDIVSIALHDCNYDTNLAIQNIFEGKYDEEQVSPSIFFSVFVNNFLFDWIG